MPASGFQWSPCAQRTPIFQVFGTKRKVEEEDDWAMDMDEQSQMEVRSKRQCVQAPAQQQPLHQGVELPQQPGFPMAPQPMVPCAPCGVEMPVSQPDVASWLQQAQRTQQHPAGAASLESMLPNCVPFPEDSQLIMQDCPPVQAYPTNHSICEMEAASISMDNDCEPDPYQYGALTAATDTACSPQQVGDYHPVRSRVHCYCKPTWEGMIFMKPYVSDIY